MIPASRSKTNGSHFAAARGALHLPLRHSSNSFSMSPPDFTIRQLVGRFVLPANPSCSFDGT
jgi:hypothetical protein